MTTPIPTTLIPAILVDVDGTLADMGKGQPGRRAFYHWDRVGEDTPIWPIIRLVWLLRPHFQPIFMSGRDEVCRDQTWEWLLRHGAAQPGDTLLMRPHKDNRGDEEVKPELYRKHVEPHYQVAYVLDDRDKVVRMWREELGLVCLQVAPGAF